MRRKRKGEIRGKARKMRDKDRCDRDMDEQRVKEKVVKEKNKRGREEA